MKIKRIVYFIICILLIATFLSLYSIEANQNTFDNDIKITIGAGMLRFTVAGLSIARPIGFGTNIRVVNKGINTYNASWELVYSSFSGDLINKQKGNFIVTPDDPTPFHKGVIIHTTIINKISLLTMKVNVGNNTVSRSGIRFGPVVLLGKYS